MLRSIILISSFALGVLIQPAFSQKKKPFEAPKPQPSRLTDSVFANIALRNIGPALMSGRIADIAIHPQDENTWYVAVGSGGVWKTTNAGVTFTPIFDSQPSYSIGCVTLDPNNPHTVWVGTGENVGGRHVGIGDGVYKSDDGGATWKNMGLKSSEHISKIIVHPAHSNIIWVASQGPLWNKGGERGIYKSNDGGATWKRTLGDSLWVGATDIAMDPRNPDVLYAATWQRHRNVANYLGGGPGSGIHRSQDGGMTWIKLTQGLPSSDMGKIGIAISPQQPDIIYAAIELDRKSGGIFKSLNRGISWEKQSDAVSGATGPHYYQELYASPHHFDRIYLMDNMMQVSNDGGKSIYILPTEHKHVDNHAIAFKKSDPDYILVGTDGGLYESFDHALTWRYMQQLPLTQFYKVAVDDAAPFYNVYGGTQDNSTQGGPSRTDNYHGIQNSDWRIILDWDGHQTATEPGNPNIVYAERQEGQLSRVDMVTGEVTDIQPQPEVGEPYERFNWDSPILVSPHQATRIYFASQRVWRSDNRGDAWTAISGDLTRNQERFSLPIMDKHHGWDAAWDVNAMSNYNTITSIAESPLQEGLIYAGTDDGLIQVTEDGGRNWRKIEVGSIPGIPATAFVNDIKADLFDISTVYVALDNHKFGDFTPYLVKSTDQGRTWQSLRNNLPDRTLVWRLVQDDEKKNLLFVAAETGIYFSVTGGQKWIRIKNEVPTISFRDLTIQRREDDLVCASFGRGFFILDDYSFLREITEDQLGEDAHLYATRPAKWYIPRSLIGFNELKGTMGASHYTAPNPPFGAVFTYYLKESVKSKQALRQESDKKLKTEGKNVPFPGWDAVDAEKNQDQPRIWLAIMDREGNVIRRISGPSNNGFHRIAWDLRYPDTSPLRLSDSSPESNYNASGFLCAPGMYTAALYKQVDGVVTRLSESVSFQVDPLRRGSLPAAKQEEVTAFWRKYEDVSGVYGAVQTALQSLSQKITAMQKAARGSNAVPGELDQRLHQLRDEVIALNKKFNGSPSKRQIGEKTDPTLGDRLFKVVLGVSQSTYGPTPTNKRSMEIIEAELAMIRNLLNEKIQAANTLSKDLYTSGAPWIEGDLLPGLD